MLTVHHTLAFFVLGVTALSAVWGGVVYFRAGSAGAVLSHLLTLSQTLLVAQVGAGLVLLSDHRRASAKLHYTYGTLALLAVLTPWFYAPAQPRKRLAWFAGSTLVAAALSVRAYTTA